MVGLWVIVLVMALGGLAMAIARPARAVRGRRRADTLLPAWITEPPLSREGAEQRSLDLLRSVVNGDEWEMYRDLGFICVAGRRPGRDPDGPPRYRYLIYPHLPVVALLPRSMAPVREYCVQFPDRTSPGATTLLPAGDDVLAKWMTLRADEDRLLAFANVASAGCQVPLGTVERDITRLERWHERRRAQKGSPASPASGSSGDAASDAGRLSAVSSSIRR